MSNRYSTISTLIPPSDNNSKLVLPPKEFIIEQLAGIPINLPIFICITGHYTQDSKKCPICRSKVIKCEFLENLIRNSTFLCPHEGCKEVKSGTEFQAHVDNFCHYRPIRCPNPECVTLIPFRFYFEHLTSRHHVSGNDDSATPSMEISLTASNVNFGMHYKRFKDNIFFIRTFTSKEECIIWVELFGKRNDEKDFVSTIRLIGKRGHQMVVRFPVSPVRTDLEALNRTLACCQLSGKFIKQYFPTPNNPTTINVAIQFLLGANDLDESLC